MPLKTLEIKEASIAAFKLTDLDSVTLGSGVTSSTTYVAMVTKTWTVPENGDYIILAVCSTRKSTTLSQSYTKLTVNGTSYSEMYTKGIDSNFGIPWKCVLVVSLTAGSNTVQIEARSETSGTVYIEYASIVILRADLFPAYFYAEERSAGGVTTNTVDPTYTNALTLTALMQNQPFLILTASFANQSVSSKILNMRTQFDGGATDLQNNKNTDYINSVKYLHSSLSKQTPSAGSHTITVDGARGATGPGSGTMKMTDTSILALQTKDDCTVWIKGSTDLLGATDIL